MITLLDEALAPVTSTIGFLKVGLEVARDALADWRTSLLGEGHVALTEQDGGISHLVRQLEPLTGGGRPRELLIATKNANWTAYLDCSVNGTDAESAIGHLARVLGCDGVYVSTVPHTLSPRLETPGRSGAVQFVMFGPAGTPPLGYLRVVSVVHDGNRWVFDTQGDVQPFEDQGRYHARQIRDRFDSQMLSNYCDALGLHPFQSDFYGPRAVLMEVPFAPSPAALVLSLEDAQRFWGITPGTAARVKG